MAKRSAGHATKMCAMTCCPCNLKLAKVKAVVRNAKYICKGCGHVAARAANLCEPVKL